VVISGAVVDEPAASTVRAREEAWVRLPEVPVKLTVAVAAPALDAAVNVVLCAVPGTSESVAGLAVTPDGSPATVTLTVPVKPFCAAAFTLTVWPMAPTVRVTVAGVDVSEKSAVRAGFTAERDPPPHDIRATSEDRQAIHQAVR
jgi:hypothetical protein